MDLFFVLKVAVVLLPVVVVAGVYLWFSRRKSGDDGERGSVWPDRTEGDDEDEDFWR